LVDRQLPFWVLRGLPINQIKEFYREESNLESRYNALCWRRRHGPVI